MSRIRLSTWTLPAGATARFDNISTKEPSAVYAQALGTQGTPVAVGCVDLPGAQRAAERRRRRSRCRCTTSCPIRSGRSRVTSWLLSSRRSRPPPSSPRRGGDLSDCPLDPAELLLDCTIDALSPPTPGDPHDCKPSHGRRRAASGTRCASSAATRSRATRLSRAVDADRQVSLDAVVHGHVRLPKPALIAALPAISDDAAHALDALELISTLDVRAGSCRRTST